MKSYWIHITNDCNLQCKYCYQPNKNIKKLTIENAKKIIHQIKMTLEDSKIVFFGGEPLLNFDIIKFIIDDLSEIKGRNFEYSFTTNLTLLTEEMLHYIIERGINIMVSIDGDEGTYNLNRFNESNNINYFKIVYQNIIKIKESGYNKVTISKVISLNNYKNLYEDTVFLSRFCHPIHYIFDMRVEDWDSCEIDGELFREQLKRLVDYYIRTLDKNILFIDSYFLKFKSLFTCEIGLYERPYCNNETDMIYSFDVDGNISPCHFLNEVFDDKIDEIKSKDILELEIKIANSKTYNEITYDEIYSLINMESKCKNCNECSYKYRCLPNMIELTKNFCFLMKFKLRNNIFLQKQRFCFDRFMFDYIFENINLERISVNDFTE